MPYIKQENRPTMDQVVDKMNEVGIECNGDLSYILFQYCRHHIERSYNNFKNFCGELRQCATEIERRLLVQVGNLIVQCEEVRKEMDLVVDKMNEVGIVANGDLNYVLFKFCKYHIEPDYCENFCSELLQCADDIEIRLLAPYEDEKIEENGDV